jgi:hypothetical protein
MNTSIGAGAVEEGDGVVPTEVYRVYGVHRMPTTMFIASEGKIFSSRMGLLPEKDREPELLRLLQTLGEDF